MHILHQLHICKQETQIQDCMFTQRAVCSCTQCLHVIPCSSDSEDWCMVVQQPSFLVNADSSWYNADVHNIQSRCVHLQGHEVGSSGPFQGCNATLGSCLHK